MLELLWAAANEGTGQAARLSTPTFGKTGTSQGGRDAYFIGFSGDLIVGVWIGYDDNRPIPGAQGGHLPATIWHAFMTQAVAPAGKAPPPPPQPREQPAVPSDSRALSEIDREYDVEEQPASPEPEATPQPDGSEDDGSATAPVLDIPPPPANRPVRRPDSGPAPAPATGGDTPAGTESDGSGQ
jgi:penicillin-binding protein 1A